MPDKFHVGQTCALVLDASTGYAHLNGQLVIVMRGRQFGHYHCSEPGSSRPDETQPGLRYEIQCPWGAWFVEEAMLRAVYDGEALSTWETFAKETGLRMFDETCK